METTFDSDFIGKGNNPPTEAVMLVTTTKSLTNKGLKLNIYLFYQKHKNVQEKMCCRLSPRAVIRIPVKFLTPTQPDTGKLPPNTHTPISCYYDPKGRIVIVDGHKRYYAMLKRGQSKKIAVRRVSDPSY